MHNCVPHLQKLAPDKDGSHVLQMQYSYIPLSRNGMVIPVTLSSINVKTKNGEPKPVKSKTVMALLDTGCSITSVDTRLADELGLQAIGNSRTQTAAGEVVNSNYIVDISFPSDALSPFIFQKICSSVC